MKFRQWKHFGGVDLARKVIDEMNRIFDIIKERVEEDDSNRIVHIQRDIKAKVEECNVVDFVKHAGIYCFKYLNFKCSVFEYKDNYYLLVNDKYSLCLENVGLELLDTLKDEVDIFEIIQGCEMLAITNGVITIRDDVTSMKIIDACLGLENNEFVFDELYNIFFEKSSVFKIDLSGFELLFEEDCCRIAIFCLASEQSTLSNEMSETLHQLALLKSSRSIAFILLNGIESSFTDYAFLQFYQCLEYLFKLDSSFAISDKFDIKPEVSINVVCEYEFKISERDSLKGLVSKYSNEIVVDNFISMLDITPQEDLNLKKKQEFISKRIYDLRCSIAHFRYGQDRNFENIERKKIIDGTVNLLLSIYQKLDNKIISICDAKNSWHKIKYSR